MCECFCVFCVLTSASLLNLRSSFVWFRLFSVVTWPVPVQSVAWKDSSLKLPAVCQVSHWTLLIYHFDSVSLVSRRASILLKIMLYHCDPAPVGERSIAISLSVCMCVCLSVCLSASISLEPLVWCPQNFVCRSPVAMAQCSSGHSNTLCTSGFMDDVTFGCNGPYGDYPRCDTGAESDVYEYHVWRIRTIG